MGAEQRVPGMTQQTRDKFSALRRSEIRERYDKAIAEGYTGTYDAWKLENLLGGRRRSCGGEVVANSKFFPAH